MRHAIPAIVFGLAMLLPGGMRSQAPQEKSTLETLQAMKKTNAELIEKQQKTLEVLDKLEEQAKQLKIFGKRA